MTQPPPTTSASSPKQDPIIEHGIERLRALCQGNGVDPQSVTLTRGEGETYLFEGSLTLEPYTQVAQIRHEGFSRDKKAETFDDIATLHQTVKSRQQEHVQNSSEWREEIIRQVRTEKGDGWGLDGAIVTLSDSPKSFSAVTFCPHCQGNAKIPCMTCQTQGFVVCTQCHGQGKELCFICGGTGKDLQYPETRPCYECHGTTLADCRNCVKIGRTAGQMACPDCRGTQSHVCDPCKGSGRFTDTITLTLGARSRFQFKAMGNTPASLNRALHRLGVNNLPKGHIDLDVQTPKYDDESLSDNTLIPKNDVPFLFYRAKLPFADIVANVDKYPVKFSVFGKKKILLNLPPFLDALLAPVMAELEKATRGQADLIALRETRVVDETIHLILRNHDASKGLHRIYGTALSSECRAALIATTRRALRHITLTTRTITAIILGGIHTLLWSLYFHSHVVEAVTHSLMLRNSISLFLYVCTASVSAFIMAASIRYFMVRHFKEETLSFWQPIGKIGWGMVGYSFIAFILSALLG